MSNRRLVNRCLMGAVLAVPATLLGIYKLGFAQDPPSAAFPAEEAPPQVLRVAQADSKNGEGDYSTAQDVPGGVAVNPESKKWKTAGVNACNGCHSKTGPNAKILALSNQKLDDGWCLLNEVITWGNMDKHFSAYAVLLSDRSKMMAKNLGIMENGKSVIHRDVRCLACHSGLPISEMGEVTNGRVSAEVTDDPRLNLGVSCEGCHGPSESADILADTRGWKDPHDDDGWRYLSPKIKAERFGFYDVRNPVSRTRMCTSCHIGNAKEGRVVTHEMYAAGHPPLPGFELETFADQEPEHWRNFRNKPEDVRKTFLEKTEEWRDYDWSKSTAEDTRDVLIAALVNLSEYVKLTADLADPAFDFPLKSDKWSAEAWPELAQFACYACHHDLQAEGWRIQRKPIGVPGRPPLYEWPVALAQVAMRSAETSAEKTQKVNNLIEEARLAAVDGPFGNREKLQSQGRELARHLDEIAMKLQQEPFTQDSAQQVLADITDVAQSQVWDYDSARQLVWAYRITYQDLTGGAPSVQDLYQTDEQGLTDVPGWYKNEENLDPIQEVLNSFQDILMLSLREGRVVERREDGPNLPYLEWDAEKALSPIGDYDPDQFKELMAKLASLQKNVKVRKADNKAASE